MKKRKKNRKKQNLPLLMSILAIILIVPVTILVTKNQQNTNTKSLAAAGQNCKGIYIPADYSNSGPEMAKTIAAGSAVSFIRANNGSGPGSSADPALVADITQARANGTRVMGYVDTSFGARDPNAVKADIDKWKQFFNVTDIMFDNAYEQDTSKVAYYQDLTTYVHQTPGAMTKMNAGDIIPEAYLQAADILGIFEGPYSKFTGFQVPAWVQNYPSTRFSAEVHSVPDATVIPNAFTLFQQNNIGYIMLTDSTNPWTGFSTDAFWTAFVSAVKTNCTPGNPQPSISLQPSGALPTPTPPFATPSFVCAGSQNGICATPTLTPRVSMVPSASQPSGTNMPTDTPVLQPSQPISTAPILSQPSSGNGNTSGNILLSLLKILLEMINTLLTLLKQLL